MAILKRYKFEQDNDGHVTMERRIFQHELAKESDHMDDLTAGENTPLPS